MYRSLDFQTCDTNKLKMSQISETQVSRKLGNFVTSLKSCINIITNVIYKYSQVLAVRNYLSRLFF